MLKKLAFTTCMICTIGLIAPETSNAAGFSRLKAAGSGLSGDEAGGDSGDGGDGKGGGKGGSSKYVRPGDPMGFNHVVFLGQFETYLPIKRYNARLSIFAEPKGLKFANVACKKTVKIRDRINSHLFKNPPSTDAKGRIDTEGMDKGIRTSIKKALKTKLEYFTSIYVVNGRYSTHKIPKTLEERKVTDCAGIIQMAKDAEDAAKNK